MLTTREAATALGADSLDRLTARLGFLPALDLGRADRARFELRSDAKRVAIARGADALRALLVEYAPTATPLRTHAVALARTVIREGPRMRWLLLARHAGSGELLIAAPSPDGRGPIPALLIETGRVRESDAETYAALVAGSDGVDLLVHLRWRETLGRDALTGRFYRDLEGAVGMLADTATGRVDSADRRTLALLATSRLLFLAFAEAKGWLDGDRAFLRHGMERHAGGAGLHRRFLDPLFFGTLNTPPVARAAAARSFGRVPFLNGGLFARAGIEKRCRSVRFTDDALGTILGDLLVRYRLTARETTSDLSDAAVDPEMLGRAFESLMSADSRRRQGAFYTPHALTAGITRRALDALLQGNPAEHPAQSVRVLDPACGSGAFLVLALEALAAHLAASGDPRPVGRLRREVLTRCIYGVDRDPTAVWLCQLRLWLAVMVEEEASDPMRLSPLPNLDRNVREGDSLAGNGFEDAALWADPRIESLRLRYVRASGVRKRSLSRVLDRAERARAHAATSGRIVQLMSARLELIAEARSPDLFRARRGLDARARHALVELRERLRTERRELRRLRDGGALPFSFATHFPEVAAAGGFDLVVGNPPWVRPHAVPPAMRVALRSRFVSMRNAAWADGAAAAAAGRGFASQADLAAPFTERAVCLARPNGLVALLLPAKLWSALAGGGIREFLTRRTTLLAIDDWSSGSAGFDAAVYPTAILARVRAPELADDSTFALTRWSGEIAVASTIGLSTLALDRSPGAPWLLIPPEVRTAFDVLVEAGAPLSSSRFGRPLLGVKTGCNEAFVVSPTGALAPTGLVSVRSAEATGTVELESLRPLLRGEDLRAWRPIDEAGRNSIVWTHDTLGEPAATVAPATRRWLSRWRRTLEMRSDCRGARWWTLFRTESARTDLARVVWGDIGMEPRAIVLSAGDPTVPLNTCYVARAPSEDDAHALAALLNSRIAAAWLSVIAEPARGGYQRFLGWTCARLPLPRDWERARASLGVIGRAAAEGSLPAPQQLDDAVAAAFGIPIAQLAPLAVWHAD